ncbi:uncharacterized protein LOC657358 [Tribolium castaneum]|uniref:Uncharacterized protein n=1 Tax=Tribolium castaneum TaxID=7070 RepID=A0A139WCM2_TRICA|nr:PREDICTED: uncharacterized protein LOC657358 [Tribolium castaneum]KYB25670.1 hypothetical protein TcasGA2_TC034173 [Tribolium castaneum]|eukprot:XP_001810958.1 PREDICTED: uncharacterized protein LOC657358 [Tribolium castaneum]
MATFNNFPEEGRPPDSPSRKFTRKHYPPRNNSWSHPNSLICAENAEINRNVGDKKSHSLKNKLFCIKKPLDEDKTTLNILNVQTLGDSSASKAVCDNDPSCSRDRNRNSFHQDVEEALSSLLWQPYEYQNCSSCSSSVTLSDLDESSPNKGPLHSSDLNLRTQMVNNLKPSPSQSRPGKPSRDAFSCYAASRLNSQASLLELLDGGTGDSVSDCDVLPCKNSDMHLEVTEPDPGATTNVLSIPTGTHGLSSANVVGLPENPRRASVPSRSVHPRNGSEPVRTQDPITHLRSASVPKQMPNVSNINVNFYRAVPVNVVSSVPTIQCLNTLEGNNVSNVQIMPLGSGTTQVTVHNPTSVNVVRTFTSTEAQTDEIAVCPPPPETTATTREQRRKERRERRHQRRTNGTNHRHTVDSGTQANTLQNERLPDLLNSHMPPPYSPLPSNVPPPNVVLPTPMMVPPPHLQSVGPNNVVPSGLVAFPPPQVVAGQGPVAVPVPPPSGFRFPFPAGGFRRGRFSEEPPKGCCGLLAWKPGSLRWFIAVIALVAVCCVLVGTALGAMRPAGRDHLTVSLLMIGVGIVLVTVSGVAWRLTSHDSSTCRSMLGLGSTESVDVCTRRFVPRLPPSYGRPHHPYAAMMYPEFQYRPPPPSYQASMQEYRLRLLLLDRGNTPQIQAGIQNAVSPPPTYRSHAGSLLRAPLSNRRDTAQSEYSCPPSYRSQNSTNRPGTLQNSVLHSREQSLSLSESNQEESVNVVNILGSTEEDMALDNITLDSLKMEPESDINPLRMLLKGSSSDLEGSKDGNLVTIVQTSDQSPVIVTVSGSSQIEGSTMQIPSEMEILAHL